MALTGICIYDLGIAEVIANLPKGNGGFGTH